MLEVGGICKRYGSLQVIDKMSFRLDKGEVLGIIGPNGAGKSTLFNLISGDVRPDSGCVIFQDQDVTALKTSERNLLGIGRSYQVPRPFGGMTVFENVMTAAQFGGRLGMTEASRLAATVLVRTGLADKANALAGSLTLLDRKRLELARALGTRPDLLLLDEIAGGLTDDEADVLVNLIRQINAEGVSIVWIEHVVHALMQVATRLMVIHFGKLLCEGVPGEVMARDDVRRIYMGIDMEEKPCEEGVA